MLHRLAVVIGLTVTAAWLVGCGGSGGGSGGFSFPPATFSGNYHLVGLGGETTPTDTLQAIWGTASADGIGTLTLGATTANQDGVLTGSPPGAAYAFTLTPTGDLSWTFGSLEIYRGGIDRSGDAVAVGTVVAGSARVGCVAALRRGSGLSAATLAGTYHGCSYAFDPLAGTHNATLLTLVLDGAGAGVFSLDLTNVDGVVSTVGGSGATTYAVAADGTTTVAANSGGTLPDGSLVALGGSTTSGGSPTGILLLRAAGAASAATFQGTYTMVGLGFSPFGGYASLTGTATASGTGSASITGTADRGGVLTSVVVPALAYIVAADGTLVLSLSGTPLLQGAVAADGRFAILGPGNAAGNEPAVYLLIRR